jgi:hypothetical protein
MEALIKNEQRARQKRNFLATLLLSQGVPMLLGGDEFGRSQCGNNNAYCQDNEISWFDWEHADKDLEEFTRKAICLPPRSPGVPAAWVVQGSAFSRQRGDRHRLVPARCDRDVRRGPGDLFREELHAVRERRPLRARLQCQATADNPCLACQPKLASSGSASERRLVTRAGIEPATL